MDLRTGTWVAALMAIAVAAVAACASDGDAPAATETAVPAATQDAGDPASSAPTSDIAATAPVASPEPTRPPSSTPTPTDSGLFADAYDSNVAMERLLAGVGPASIYDATALDAALEAIRDNRDVSQVPVLIDLMRFLIGAAAESIVFTLEDLTGEKFGRNWNRWMEWLGINASDYTTPEEYPHWKSRLYSMVHPRFGGFLGDAGETARIDLTEVVWGGVMPDGIPDLMNPNTLTAAEAGYMHPNDRVFGVSINGEHRAYPLRIINAHEMANDVLGGEPISVLW